MRAGAIRSRCEIAYKSLFVYAIVFFVLFAVKVTFG